MPNNLFLVRHGESEGNIAVARSKKGDHSHYEGEFKKRHSSQWRLSDKGRTQAAAAGEWLKADLDLGTNGFDRCYTSEYLRAMETAALLDLEASWLTEFYLRERSWGDLDRVSVEERERRFSESLEERAVDPFYWTPPNGESLATLCLRVDRMIDTLHRECDGKNVIIVCHGEVMWAFRVRLERMQQETFRELDRSRNPLHQIHNCQIIHYTRIEPGRTFQSAQPYLGWMRSICPWDLGLSRKKEHEWQTIHRPRFNNSDLLARVGQVLQIVK